MRSLLVILLLLAACNEQQSTEKKYNPRKVLLPHTRAERYASVAYQEALDSLSDTDRYMVLQYCGMSDADGMGQPNDMTIGKAIDFMTEYYAMVAAGVAKPDAVDGSR